MATYANGISKQSNLAIRFQAIVPLQIIADTGVGDVASGAYARSMGIERAQFLARFGAPMTPRMFGDHVVAVLEDPIHSDGFAFGFRGDTGVTVLEEAAA